MEQKNLENIREKTLKGLKLAQETKEDNMIKQALEIIVMSYAQTLVPRANEGNVEDKGVRFLVNELSFYQNNL
ncbi:MAG: hypothetical protein IKI09_01460 [Bacteroidales bacterium]|nr:hypothetical protein [Bacteroidales bacterium]